MEESSLTNSYFCCLTVVYVDFLTVIDADIPGVGYIARAEERGAAEGWDHVDCACRIPEGVLEKANIRRWCWAAVW